MEVHEESRQFTRWVNNSSCVSRRDKYDSDPLPFCKSSAVVSWLAPCIDSYSETPWIPPLILMGFPVLQGHPWSWTLYRAVKVTAVHRLLHGKRLFGKSRKIILWKDSVSLPDLFNTPKTQKGMSFSGITPLLMKVYIFVDAFGKWKLDDVLNFRKARHCFGELSRLLAAVSGQQDRFYYSLFATLVF